jgi:very-short-patch-repair endonuclease
MSTNKFDAKFKSWKNNLLDLTKRNRLLNFRATSRSSIQIMEIDIRSLWDDVVVNDKPCEFPLPDKINSTSTGSGRKGKTIILNATTNVSDQYKTLQNLRSKAKIANDEQGVEILYLAFGLLKWNESASSEIYFRAPVVLVPVKLTIASIVDPFVLRFTGGEIVLNPTLAHKIFQEYKISLPSFDAEKDDILTYLQSIENELKKLSWKVDFEVHLSYFSFSKMNMYDDIEKHQDKIKAHPVVRALIGDMSGLVADVTLGNLADYDHDAQSHPQDIYQVLDADSSQLDAVLRAKKGQSFVLQGPPGTGKSQTIANIIAESLAENKKVLFVSEKVAALDVVYQRLQNVQLADYCLVLHSHKTQKKEVLNQLEATRDRAKKTQALRDSAQHELQRLQNIRMQLNEYVREIHKKIGPLGVSIYNVNGYVAQLNHIPHADFTISKVHEVTRDLFDEHVMLVKKLASIVQKNNNNWSENPWQHANITILTNERRSNIEVMINTLDSGFHELTNLLQKLRSNLALDHGRTYVEVREIMRILQEAYRSPLVPFAWIDEKTRSEVEKTVDESCVHSQKFNERFDSLKVIHQQMMNYSDESPVPVKALMMNTDGVEEYNRQLGAFAQGKPCFSEWGKHDIQYITELYEKLQSQIHTITDCEKTLLKDFDAEILSFDFVSMLNRFRTMYQNSILKYARLQYWNDKKQFQQWNKHIEHRLTVNEMHDALKRLKEIDDAKKESAQLEDSYKAMFGEYFAGLYTNTEKLNQQIQLFKLMQEAHQTLVDMRKNVKYFEDHNDEMQNGLAQRCKGIATDWEDVQRALAWSRVFQELKNQHNLSVKFVQMVCENREKVHECDVLLRELNAILDKIAYPLQQYTAMFDNGENLYTIELSRLCDRIQQAARDSHLLQDWAEYNECCADIRSRDMDDFIGKVLSNVPNRIDSAQLVDVYKKRFYQLWLDATLAKNPAVQKFSLSEHESRIQDFQKLDQEQLNIASQKLRVQMLRKMQHVQHTDIGESGVLNREISKQRNIMPIRKLFREIPRLLLDLKPCLMMSPLSVSMFLESDLYEFDVVIFDEASQIFTESAIGAILRGKQVIIAGDSKQLPPTNFFSVTESSDDTDNDDESDGEDIKVNEFESILDEAGILPQHTLLWHYRSKHEHLIAFSNAQFYRNNLITFPSSIETEEHHGVEFVYVENGTYDRSGKQGNSIEAERVAKLVFDHFEKFPKRSLGVIAFGEVQQQAIESAIRKLRKEKRNFEAYFTEDTPEAFFVKNLENVQGDERDTIIFSVGYAKDVAGKMLMNFGPLNRVGGERRLNVAVTRAKENLKLVSSIMPDDIDVRNATNEGRKLLRAYLEFALQGPSALMRALNVPSVVQHDSPFEKSVYDFLVSNGYEVSTQVGCSGYRIDMAVKNPNVSGRFLMGIECDGATYHSTRTARERDRLRQTILESMGWTIYRVWSTDWIKNPQKAGANLLSALETQKKNHEPS